MSFQAKKRKRKRITAELDREYRAIISDVAELVTAGAAPITASCGVVIA